MNKEQLNIKELRERFSLSQAEMADRLGISREMVNMMELGKRPISKSTKILLQNFISEVNSVTPLKNGSQLNHAPLGKFPRKIGMGSQPVPYYDVDFTAGDIEVYDDNNAIQPAYLMDIPEFAGCTAFRVFSNSMERLIISGSILFGTKVKEWAEHLEYGQIYGIVCNDKRRYLKYIRKAPHKDDTHFLLRSENVEEFDDFTIAKNKIKSVWLIHGWLNKRT